jgi:hypothetical protein
MSTKSSMTSLPAARRFVTSCAAKVEPSAPAKDFGEFGTTIGLRCRDDDVLDFDLLAC